MKKLGYSLFAVITACALVRAQGVQQPHKSETKITVEDGKDIKATGCVERNADGTFMLTNVANKDGAMGSYILADEEDDLKDHVGHRVEIKGKAADKGKGKVKIETDDEGVPPTATSRRPRPSPRSRGTSRACGISVWSRSGCSRPCVPDEDQYFRTTPTLAVQ